ncbi:MAG: riboflavin transport system permease protein RibX [Anaerolineaceae bacterium]|nr:MAG: riboflavin transport system permease protein RibX [Anaerolineaceae bacterium]
MRPDFSRRFFASVLPLMYKRLLPIVFSAFVFLLAWSLVARYSGIPNFILPSPLSVWTRFLRAVNDGSLAYHTGITLSEIVLGLIAGVTIATILGYLLAKSRSLEKILSPYIVASQAIPVVAIAPLLIIWLGDGILSKAIICALIVFFPVLVNTIVGVRAVPAALYDLMNSLHASRAQILWKVEAPASLPVFLGGMRVGATLSVIGAIVGELVDAQSGLGFLLRVGDFQYDTPMVFVAVFTLISLALALYGVVRIVENRFLKWQG